MRSRLLFLAITLLASTSILVRVTTSTGFPGGQQPVPLNEIWDDAADGRYDQVWHGLQWNFSESYRESRVTTGSVRIPICCMSFSCVVTHTETQQELDTPRQDARIGLPAIVFVGAPIFDEKTDGGEGVYQGSYHWRDSYIYARSATYHRGERTMGPGATGA